MPELVEGELLAGDLGGDVGKACRAARVSGDAERTVGHLGVGDGCGDVAGDVVGCGEVVDLVGAAPVVDCGVVAVDEDEHRLRKQHLGEGTVVGVGLRQPGGGDGLLPLAAPGEEQVVLVGDMSEVGGEVGGKHPAHTGGLGCPGEGSLSVDEQVGPALDGRDDHVNAVDSGRQGLGSGQVELDDLDSGDRAEIGCVRMRGPVAEPDSCAAAGGGDLAGDLASEPAGRAGDQHSGLPGGGVGA